MSLTALLPTGWVDITTTSYSGASYVIATKLTTGPISVNMSAASVEKECDAALSWGKKNGLNVTKVDGIRYSTNKSKLGNIVVNSLGYDVISVALYGYSEYNGEKLGSRLRYPSIGVDIWRFSVSAGWDHNRFRWQNGGLGNPGWHVGVSYNF